MNDLAATVLRREPLSPHLVRLALEVPGFVATGVPDECVALTLPGQPSRYYTVRRFEPNEMTIDVVLHDRGQISDWARGDVVGQRVQVRESTGPFALPNGAWWLYLVGDLTAAPAMARIIETVGPDFHVAAWVEAPEPISGYFPGWFEGQGNLTWLEPGTSLAEWVECLPWPDADGYLWMAGEAAQMRAARRYLAGPHGLPASAQHVMGYWSAIQKRVDPGPIYAAGKAAGKSDEQIWAEYDALRQAEDD